MSKFDNIKKLINSVNIAKTLDIEELNKIGSMVVRDFEIDWDSCSEWRRQNDEAMKLAKQVKEEKNFPWPGAASVKYPLITVGAIQFASRAYPELVKDDQVVKARIVGQDPDGEKRKRSDRVAAFMSYQFMEEIGDWEEDTDRLLHILPVIGCLFRKGYYNGIERRNDSVLLLPDEFVVHYKTKNLKTCRRMSHILKFYQNDIYERQSSGIWLDGDGYDFGEPPDKTETEDDSPHTFIEQHRYLDLDEDGYNEPYIVTVHKDTKKVVRITARYDEEGVEINGKNEIVRIKADNAFVKYGFIPNPDGGFLDIGFGTLMYPINEAVNTTLNELLDAGAAHNAGGGFIGRGINIKGGKISFQLNEWKTIEATGQSLRDNIVPLPTREPSQVLFLLLGTLIDAGKDISSVKNVLMGEKPGENVSNELYMSLVDQGLKVFTGIYKRIYRSLKQEFQLHYRLNSIYLDEKRAFNVLDDENFIGRADFNYKDCNILPVADPNLALDVQRMARANVLRENMGMPGMIPMAITKRWLDAMRIPNQEEIYNPQQQLPKDPKVEEIYLKMGLMRDKHNLEKQEIFAKILVSIAQAKELYTRCVLNIAKAEAEEAGPQIEQYKTFVDELGVRIKQQEADIQREQGVISGQANQGGTPQVEAGPGNAEGT